ncbi:MAG TPA: dienelactone hydrolase family protein [Polyangia bacterium]|jgi:carboxymethylenebutenolidase
MAILTETISEPGFSGYLARPERAAGPLPGVLVIQEAWGVDAHIEDVTRRFAAAGYVALAPDLFAEGGHRSAPFARERMAELQAFMNAAPPTVFADAGAREAALAKLPDAERTRVGESLGALTSVMAPARREGLLAAVQAAARYLREARPETRGQRIAALGFCLGGGLSGLLACRDPELGAAVIFYGNPPPAEEIPKIRCPVMVLVGTADQRIAGQIPAFSEAMSAAGKRLESLSYEGAGHAFFNDGRPAYNLSAARDAFPRVLAFLRDALV